jgi:hypothetical protein
MDTPNLRRVFTRMKTLMIVLVLLALTDGIHAQPIDDARNNAFRDARHLATLLSTGDGINAASMIHPNALVALGGSQRVAAAFSVGPLVAHEKGITIAVSIPSPPEEVATVGVRLFAIVNVRTQLHTSNGNVDIDCFWLGVSEDSGAKWSFVIFPHASNAMNDAQKLFPEGTGGLVFPTTLN